jgi:hypothetical protein
MTAKSPRRIDNAKWMENARADLESAVGDWVSKTPAAGMSKLEAIGQRLDVILTELGYPPPPHKCPDCGNEHVR